MNIFTPQQLQKIIDDVIPAADPKDEHSFVLVGGVNRDGAQVVARFEKDFKRGWSLGTNAAWEHDWTGDDHVGAKVLVKWK